LILGTVDKNALVKTKADPLQGLSLDRIANQPWDDNATYRYRDKALSEPLHIVVHDDLSWYSGIAISALGILEVWKNR